MINLAKNLKVCDGLKTLVIQEMFKRKILFQCILICGLSHNKKNIDDLIKSFDNVLQIYRNTLNKGYKKYLYGKKIKPVFRKII